MKKVQTFSETSIYSLQLLSFRIDENLESVDYNKVSASNNNGVNLHFKTFFLFYVFTRMSFSMILARNQLLYL